ncbi:hypothetical protein ScFU53_13470 [Streptococcus canis]|nr:hypothetical protein ScFU53_13470 [Streptococcus canis]
MTGRYEISYTNKAVSDESARESVEKTLKKELTNGQEVDRIK